MKKIKSILCLWLILSCSSAVAVEEASHAEVISKPLYVSLGAHCEVANFIGYYGLRTAAYPFDWMLTLNHSLISVLQDNFAHFVDESYLTNHRFGVVNSYYSIDFRHDWPDFGRDWPKMDLRRILPEVKEKYCRRIARFYDLADYSGKVYFIRAPLDIDYPLEIYPTFTKEAKRITADEALAIRDLLLEKFPALDFHLIIINYEEEGAPLIENVDRVYEFRVRLSHKFEDWKSALDQLEASNGGNTAAIAEKF